MPYSFSAKKLRAKLHRAAALAVAETTIQYQNQIRKTLSQPGTGRKYKRNRVRSSAPGKPPVAQTGTLRQSWQSGVKHRTTRFLRQPAPKIRLGSAVKYARWMQYGNRRVKPRPYVNVAAKRLRRSGIIQRIVRRQIGKALR